MVVAQGTAPAETIRSIGRDEFRGLKLDQSPRLEELEQENAGLRRAGSDLTLDEMIPAEAARGT